MWGGVSGVIGRGVTSTELFIIFIFQIVFRGIICLYYVSCIGFASQVLACWGVCGGGDGGASGGLGKGVMGTNLFIIFIFHIVFHSIMFVLNVPHRVCRPGFVI